MRLKTCYGLCSLKTGVKIVAIYEMITYTILFFISIFESDMFNKSFPMHDDVITFHFLHLCLVVLTLLKLFSAVCLMQATFRNTPCKIFFWIVIACITYLAVFLVAIKIYVPKFYLDHYADAVEPDLQLEYKLLFAFILINVVSVIEIHVVASYYLGEKRSDEAEFRTRVQNLLSSHMTTHSLNRHRPDVFYSDYAGSSMLRRPCRAQSSFFSSFKGRPSYRYDVPTNILSV